MDSSSFGLYSPIKYLSKDRGPCVRIFIGVASSSKKISTVFEPRSWTSKFWTKHHMLLRVHTKASTLTRRFVKSRATRILLFFTTSGARLAIWASFMFSDKLAHFPVMSSMWGCGWKGRKRREECSIDVAKGRLRIWDRRKVFHLRRFLRKWEPTWEKS